MNAKSVTFRMFASRPALEAATADLLGAAFAARSATPVGVMLTGGRTPLAVYAALAQRPPAVDPNLRLLLSDERHVPPGTPDHNFSHLAGLVNALGLPDVAVLRPDTALPLDTAAAHYDQALRQFLAGGTISLGILGLGADGHLASLFTDADAGSGPDACAIAVRRPSPPHRISVTSGLLCRVGRLVFVVAGRDKAAVVAAWQRHPDTVLAARVVQACGAVECWYGME